MTKPDYISEVDTLRAVAVLLVVAFHVAHAYLPGGFIGVDVFFVISGFVISRAYLSGLLSGERTFTEFYISRIRRLAPALIVVLLCSSVASIFILYPDRLIAFAWSIAAQVVYLQNFVFWHEGDYFSAALTKPLLHTWSLAVEEQFYVLWTLGVLLAGRFQKHWLIILTIVAIASYGLGFWLEARSPKTAFYMFPTRIWQFSLGILAHLLSVRIVRLSTTIAWPLGCGALILIVLAATLFDETAAFPGPQSLLACIACAVALTCFATQRRPLAILNLRPVLYVGRISYGFYLWHWPPLVFYYLKFGHPPDVLMAAGIAAMALLMASATYHLVENPIRTGIFVGSTSAVVKTAGFAGFGLLILGVVLVSTEGALFRYPQTIQPFFLAAQEKSTFRCGKSFRLLNPTLEMCPINTATRSGGVLILGDSHADVLDRMIGELGLEHTVPVYLTVRNCDLGSFGDNEFCSDDVLKDLLSAGKDREITDILAISFWEIDESSEPDFFEDVEVVVNAGFTVHLMEVPPFDLSYDPTHRAVSALQGEKLRLEGIPLVQHVDTVKNTKMTFAKAAAKHPESITILSPAEVLCEISCKYHIDGVPLYVDYNHLSVAGTKQLAPLFGPMFSRITNRAAYDSHRPGVHQ
jgi:peptidoglycan/LPS O-acetylase OafA/YrhL